MGVRLSNPMVMMICNADKFEGQRFEHERESVFLGIGEFPDHEFRV